MYSKELKAVIGGAILLCLGTLGVIRTANAGFNSPGAHHNFQNSSWNTKREICIVCHIPHNAQDLPNAPLWNHTMTTSTHTLYSSSTLNATVGEPSASSKACLSCHDGTVAVRSFGGYTPTPPLNPFSATSRLNLKTDLSNDHPISIVYDSNLASLDPELNDPATQPSGMSGSTGTIREDMLINDRVECVSCHDIHNRYATYGYGDILVKAKQGSALCLTCHKK